MAPIKLYLFGPPRLERQGRAIPINLRKALALLIYLAVTRQPHSRDALATLFWPEKDQQSARANLRRTLYDLSQLLDAQLLAITPETVTLAPTAPLWLDVECFQQALTDHLPATLLMVGVSADALSALVEAADYYSDDFLAGFTLPDAPEFDDWQFFQREELRGAFARLLQQVIATYVAQAKFEEAVRYARRWLLLDPLEEAVHRQLMQLYAQAGQQAAAVRQYDECVRILAAELDVSPAAETTALYESIRTRRFPGPDKKTSDKMTSVVQSLRSAEVVSKPHLVTLSPPHPVTPAPLHNLPTQNTPFVGRQQELAELIHRLVDPACRLLTIVGPGGIGKTRVAMALIQQMVAAASPQHQFKDGLFFVPLQPVNAASGVIPAIADALGFHFYGGALPQEQLFNFLREKQMLLLLDNFEHLLTAADLVAALLAVAPDVKVLVTSREALKLQEEWFHPLSGLRLPPQSQPSALHRDGADDPEATVIEGYDAVQLFNQTARRALVDFDPELHQAAIVRICRLVDGMPLALELAAAWLKVLSCTQIADEIARGGKILVTRHQNVPTRHRNMQVVMEQSWQLLDEPTQEILSRLSVFQGGFDQDAALAVAGADLLTLAELVDKAWVYHRSGERYQMHELLRQFAAEKLTAAGADQAETDEWLAQSQSAYEKVRGAHAGYYLRFLQERLSAMLGGRQHEARNAISNELDNWRLAWDWAIVQGDVAALARVAPTVSQFFQMHSRFQEGATLFAEALAAIDKAPPSAARTQAWATLSALLGWLYIRNTRFQAAQTLLDQSVAFHHQTNHSPALGLGTDPRLGLGILALLHGQNAAAAQLANAALAISQRDQQPWNELFAWNLLGFAHLGNGEIALSQQAIQQAITLAQRHGDRWFIAYLFKQQGNVAMIEQDTATALHSFERSYAHHQEFGDQEGMAGTLNNWGDTALQLGRRAEAQERFQQALQLYQTYQDKGGLHATLSRLGYVALLEGDVETARRYLQQALTFAAQHETNVITLTTLLRIGELLLQVHAVEQSITAFAYVYHHPVSEPTIQLHTATLLDRARAATTPTHFQSLYTDGQRMSFDQLATALLPILATPFTGKAAKER